ncbi:hypothetical protein [Planctomicrobium piriforme]|uniref:Uncharacterized protein n=1 Tax=Planctomicrobium piriforme TaxID=1576369 RepID=A0A1I3GPI8_9PLAN|nr:hypothetical protein [Planctomicrobium piriforme]SFI25398.1 hypothetical protein SAMN05421753_10781 [Planctomicrobium piriforme]
MKTSRIFGGAIVGALLLGIWFGQFWKGPGLGGSGSGDGKPESGSVDTRAEVRSISGTGAVGPTARTNEASTPAGPEIGLPAQMVTVVIHGNQYRLVQGDDFKLGSDVTLDDIKRQAADTTGTPEGIRVRVVKEKSAQEGPRSDLLTALAEAGVKREEIQERAEFIK